MLDKPVDAPKRKAVTSQAVFYQSLAWILLMAIVTPLLVPEKYYAVVAFFLGSALMLLPIVCGIRARNWILVSVFVGIYVALAVFSASSLFRTRRLVHEMLPIPNLRTINKAEATYLSKTGRYGTMTDLIAARLLDDNFGGPKAGYTYSITLDAMGRHYSADAVPVSPRGSRHGYYITPDAEVRYSTDPSLAPTPEQAGKDLRPRFPVRRIPPAPFR